MAVKTLPIKKPAKSRRSPAGGITGPAGDRLAANWAKLSDAQKKRFSARTKEIATQAVDTRKKRSDGRY